MAMLNRIKTKLKKIAQKKSGLKAAKEVSTRKAPSKEPERVRGQALGIQEMTVEKSKFYTGQVVRAPRAMPQDLPAKYGQDKIVLQVRDPWWIHAYWELQDSTLERLRNELKDEFHQVRRMLRVYDVSNIIFNGKNAHRSFDIYIHDYSSNWYIDTGGPGRSWCVDLGLLLPGGRFITIVRSNTVLTPLEGPSRITDEEWMIPEDMFARLYGMGFGFGRSSPVGKAAERMRRELFSGILASPGITSVTSPAKRIPKERKFWLIVNTELIVYGATEPDARVFVQGREIKLRPDGTFSLRFALPDGKQVIPVKGVSSDNLEERTITPIVTKETK